MTVTEHTVDSGGIRLNVAAAGHGPPVLLLHGFPDSWQLWRHQIDALAAAGHQVIAPDLRGFGASDRPEDVQDYRMPLLLSDIRAILGHFGVERVDVVGHDWGAAVAWSLAQHLPESVDRLAVLSVGHPGASAAAGILQRQLSWYMLWFLHEGVAEAVLPADDWAAFRQWAWDSLERGADVDLDRQIADLSRPGALVAALNLYRANIRPANYFVPTASPEPTPPLARTVAGPVLGIWSTGDLFLSEQQMTLSAGYVDGLFRYERLPGAHWIPVQAAEPLSALLADFLS